MWLLCYVRGTFVGAAGDSVAPTNGNSRGPVVKAAPTNRTVGAAGE
jgi:hypothetical protein